MDPESLKAGSEEMVIKFVDREGARREVAVQVAPGDASLVKRVKEMGERALKELGVVSPKRLEDYWYSHLTASRQPSAPRIDHYTPPSLSQALIVALAIGFQAYVVFSPDPTPRGGPNRSLGTAIKAGLNRLPYGEWILPASVVLLVVAVSARIFPTSAKIDKLNPNFAAPLQHSIEAIYMDSRTVRHHVPPGARLAWDVTTFLFGYPSMNQFERQGECPLFAAAVTGGEHSADLCLRYDRLQCDVKKSAW